jgi:thiol-disulfide isomerase/thioredoxin
MRHLLAVGCTAVLLSVTACSDDASDALPEDRVAVPDGPALADVELVDFDDQPVRLTDYAGRPLVVNLFASWCAPCVREMPAIEEVKQEVGGEVAFLGVATNDRVEDALALVEQTGITWDLARDPHGEAATSLGMVRMPTTFLVSPDGQLVAEHAGELEADELRDLLAEHFGVEA